MRLLLLAAFFPISFTCALAQEGGNEGEATEGWGINPLVVFGVEEVPGSPSISPESFPEFSRAISGFYSAKTVVERMQYVVEVPGIEARMQEFYERKEEGMERAPDAAQTLRCRILEKDGVNYIGIDVAFIEGGEGRAYLEANKAEQGRYLMDWESLVGYCDVPWSEVREQEAEEVLVRIEAKAVDVYEEPEDSESYVSIQLLHPYRKGVFFAYVRRGTELERALGRRLFSPRTKQPWLDNVPMTLRLQRLEDRKKYEVIEIVSPSWHVR